MVVRVHLVKVTVNYMVYGYTGQYTVAMNIHYRLLGSKELFITQIIDISISIPSFVFKSKLKTS